MVFDPSYLVPPKRIAPFLPPVVLATNEPAATNAGTTITNAYPDHEDVQHDIAEGIAERLANGGVYEPPGGDEAIYVSMVRTIVHIAALAPAMGVIGKPGPDLPSPGRRL